MSEQHIVETEVEQSDAPQFPIAQGFLDLSNNLSRLYWGEEGVYDLNNHWLRTVMLMGNEIEVQLLEEEKRDKVSQLMSASYAHDAVGEVTSTELIRDKVDIMLSEDPNVRRFRAFFTMLRAAHEKPVDDRKPADALLVNLVEEQAMIIRGEIYGFDEEERYPVNNQKIEDCAKYVTVDGALSLYEMFSQWADISQTVE